MIDYQTALALAARKAYELEAVAEYGNWKPNEVSEELLKSMHGVFIEFAKLVAKDCAMIAYQNGEIEGEYCANAILYEYDVDNCRGDK